MNAAAETGCKSATLRLLLASSNPGKLREYCALAAARPDCPVDLALLPGFDTLAGFGEDAPTFAENAAGKALHYSRFADELVMADDSGLVVDALGGGPGVHSARYGGPQANDADRWQKVLQELARNGAANRCARFVCVIALARAGRMVALLSDFTAGEIAGQPRGVNGFGYDPIFFFPALGKTFAEMTPPEKNAHSHRGKAFRKLLDWLQTRAARGALGDAKLVL